MNHLRSVPDDAPTPGASSGTAATNSDLAALLKRSSRGDQAAFAQLYDALAAKVHGLALRVVRDPAQAEEVTQETFLEVWRLASRFDPERGSASAWVITLAHRRAVDRVRAAQAATRRDEAYAASNQTPVHDQTAEAATAALEASRVRGALTSLTDMQREAVELAYLSGYTHTEVAALLDVPLGTAKTRIRDGLIRLRDTLGVAAR